jgi:transposase
MASVHLQHMQRALDQMSLQIHRVISDIAGSTGLDMIDAIRVGKRDPKRLADLLD